MSGIGKGYELPAFPLHPSHTHTQPCLACQILGVERKRSEEWTGMSDPIPSLYTSLPLTCHSQHALHSFGKPLTILGFFPRQSDYSEEVGVVTKVVTLPKAEGYLRELLPVACSPGWKRTTPYRRGVVRASDIQREGRTLRPTTSCCFGISRSLQMASRKAPLPVPMIQITFEPRFKQCLEPPDLQ